MILLEALLKNKEYKNSIYVDGERKKINSKLTIHSLYMEVEKAEVVNNELHIEMKTVKVEERPAILKRTYSNEEIKKKVFEYRLRHSSNVKVMTVFEMALKCGVSQSTMAKALTDFNSINDISKYKILTELDRKEEDE